MIRYRWERGWITAEMDVGGQRIAVTKHIPVTLSTPLAVFVHAELDAADELARALEAAGVGRTEAKLRVGL